MVSHNLTSILQEEKCDKKTRLCKQENVIHNIVHNNTEYLGFCSTGQYIFTGVYIK